jgi:hypothetical protein
MSLGIVVSIGGLMFVSGVVEISISGKVVSSTNYVEVAWSYLSFSSNSSSSVADSCFLRFDSCTILRIYKSKADGAALLGSVTKLLYEGSLQPTHRTGADVYPASITCLVFSTTTLLVGYALV